MKTLWDISWSKYSWEEIWQILRASPFYLLNLDTNILDIGISSKNVKLVKKILEEENIDVNEQNAYGNTALHTAVLLGNFEMVKFLINEKEADILIKTPNHEIVYSIGVTIKGGSSVIDLSVDKLDLDMTIYFLELGLDMPQVNTILIGDTDSPDHMTGKKFCRQLYNYFLEKKKQHPDELKFKTILEQVINIQKDFYVGHSLFKDDKKYYHEKIDPLIDNGDSLPDNYDLLMIGKVTES